MMAVLSALLTLFVVSFSDAAMLPPVQKLFASVAAKSDSVAEKIDDAGDGPWQSVEQGSDANHRNICNVGRQLPDFYVIGQQKCGTSSIAQDLMAAGVGNVHGPHNDKEFHFFDAVSRLDFSLTGQEGLKANRASLLEWMPECPAKECFTANFEYTPKDMAGQEKTIEASAASCQSRCSRVTGCGHFTFWANGGCHIQDDDATMQRQDDDATNSVTNGPPSCSEAEGFTPRRVLADFTPSYLALVPFPEDMETSGPWLKAYDVHANAPAKVRELYGEVASEKLQFAIMLREPLSQMQSAWYHAQSFNFTNVCSSCTADSFRDALQMAVTRLGSSPPAFTQWVWNVMYGRHLEEWLRHFKASQFYIVPTNVYSKGDSTAICGDLSSRLGFQMACSSASGDDETTHAWTHEHPSLSEDTDGLRTPFEDLLMTAENDRLVNVLVQASRDGMGLANYEGERGDKETIKQWLEQGW